MAPKQNRVLNELVSVLLAEWGYEAVHRALEFVGERYEPQPGRERREPARGRTPAPRRRITALEYLAGSNVPEQRRDALAELALRYDRKQFLPTASDLRHFYSMRGEELTGLKHRSEAFRPVLRLLLKMPPEQVEALVRDNAHSGPSQLGPIADAIREASAAVRSPGLPQDRAGEDEPPPVSHEGRSPTSCLPRRKQAGRPD